MYSICFYVIGCGPSEQAPGPKSSTGMPTQEVGLTESIELKFATWVSEISDVGQLWREWGRRIEEQSEGRVKITNYWSQSLVEMPDGKRAAREGVTDIATLIINFTEEEPLHEVFTLPFIGIPPVDGPSIYQEITNKFTEFSEEFVVKTLGVHFLPPNHFFSVKKEVRLPADLKGMKVIAGKQFMDLVTVAGGAPMSLPGPDWYTSLERGLAEGHFTTFPTSNVESCLELLNYYTMFGETGASTGLVSIVMNIDTWNSLPADLQEIFNDAAKWYAEEGTKWDLQEYNRLYEECKEQGKTFIYLTPEEIAIWKETAKPAHKKWIDTYSNLGPTQEIYDELVRIVKEYSS